jgi:dihydrofolate reductase
VLSSTLERADWANTTIIGGDVPERAAELKRADGRDLVVYGHGWLGRTLLEHGLLDEINLFVHPIIVGHGTLLFDDGEPHTLEHVATRTLETRVVALTYWPREQS